MKKTFVLSPVLCFYVLFLLGCFSPSQMTFSNWTAITLANNKQVDKGIPILKKVFARDSNWKELTRRLPKVNLLTVSDNDLKKILSLWSVNQIRFNGIS